MPLLLLQALAPLLKRRDTYYLAAIAVLALLLWTTRNRARLDEALLAAKPKVETHVEVKTETKTEIRRVVGPERVIVRTVIRPGGVQVITRYMDRGPVTTTTDKDVSTDKVADKVVTPAALLLPAPRAWSLNLGLNAFAPSKMRDASLGVSRSFGVLSLGYAHTLGGPFMDGNRVTLGLKF